MSALDDVRRLIAAKSAVRSEGDFAAVARALADAAKVATPVLVWSLDVKGETL